jgi:hypothetical protein
LTGNIDVEGGEVLVGPNPKIVTHREIELAEKLPPEKKEEAVRSRKVSAF